MLHTLDKYHIFSGFFGAWRSPVAHLNGVQGAAGSNPVAPTAETGENQISCFIFTLLFLYFSIKIKRKATMKTSSRFLSNFSFKLIAFMLMVCIAMPVMAGTALQGLVILVTDWAYEATSEARSTRITNLIEKAKEENFNAIIFEVRESGESIYPHPDPVWSTLLDEQDPGFDPLEIALDVAHDKGLPLYAKFDVLKAYSKINKPQSTNHIYYMHPEWFLKDDQDNYIEYDASYYLDPMNPKVITFLKEQVGYLVKNYKLDGISFSGMTYPGDKILQRSEFFERYLAVKNLINGDEKQFAREGLTSCLEALSTEIKMVKPYLFLSAEVHKLRIYDKSKKKLLAAYDNFMQDGKSWYDRGVVDALIPLIHDRSKNIGFYYNQYAGDEDNYVILPSLRGDIEVYRESDVKKSIDYLKKKNVKGILVYSASDAFKGKKLFESASDLPYMARTHTFASAVQLDMSGQELKGGIIKNEIDSSLHFADDQGYIQLIMNDLPSKLKLQSMKLKMRFNTRGWVKPYRYDLISNKRVQRPEKFIELRRSPAFISTDSSYAFLFRASEGITSINNEIIIPYSNTRIFWKDIALKPLGLSTKVRGSLVVDNETLFYEDIFMGNFPDTTTKHPIVLTSVSPKDTVLLPPDDRLRITFSSMMPENLDTVLLYANGKIIPCEFNGKKYVAEVPCSLFDIGTKVLLQVAARDNEGNDYAYNLPTAIKVTPTHEFPVLESIADFSQVSYSLGEVRLGGPYMSEFPAGIRFKCDGKFGSNYRLKLSNTEYGYIPENEVRELPATSPIPHYNLYNLHVRPDSMKDVLTIPWPEPVPYALLPQPELNRLRLRLFGVQSNSTWLTHVKGLEVIDHISWEQINSETYDIYVYLQDSDIWGYNLVQNEKSLSLSVKHPPVDRNLTIAIEAGHGGAWNWGAVGLSGLKEKDINLDTADKLAESLRDKGYNIIRIREGDEDIKLRDRWLTVEEADPDLFVSIHANAAGGHYLRVAGTSTYYHNPFWRSLAEQSYDELLKIYLEEFGVIGSFNYMMCRMSNRPSFLVEQAFMSHAGDENKLANPEFRSDLAERVAVAIDEYLNEKLAR